jgi:hypothetical protein
LEQAASPSQQALLVVLLAAQHSQVHSLHPQAPPSQQQLPVSQQDPQAHPAFAETARPEAGFSQQALLVVLPAAQHSQVQSLHSQAPPSQQQPPLSQQDPQTHPAFAEGVWTVDDWKEAMANVASTPRPRVVATIENEFFSVNMR